MQNDDFTYFSARSEEEAALAGKSGDARIAAVHRQLSDLYKARAASLAGSDVVRPGP